MNDKTERISLGGLGNYYGSVYAESINSEYTLKVDDWDRAKHIEISEEFFNAIKKEFGGNN